MTKKGRQTFWRMKIGKSLWEKVKSGKLSTESENFFGNRGKCETEGNASLPQRGMDAPGRGVNPWGSGVATPRFWAGEVAGESWGS